MSFDDAAARRVSEAAKAALADLRPAGFSVGVVEGDRLAYAEGFGFADIESGRPQHPGLRQRIGSITKTMVGLSTLALVDEGRLSLDDRVADHIPELTIDGDADALTLRRLLTHTGGIGEVATAADVKRVEESLWSSSPDANALGLFPDGLTLDVPPGTKWAYANLGFALLGEIVARAEGKPIAQVLAQRIFEPLGMENSDLFDHPHPDLATGYHHPPIDEVRELSAKGGRPLPEETPVDGRNIRGEYKYIRGGGAAGAVQSTVPDMARYASALLARDGGIVRPETFDQMLRPHWQPDERLAGWGLSFERDRRFGRLIFGHGGGVLGGWNSMLVVAPKENLALVVHANTMFDDFGKLESRLLAAMLDASPDASTATLDDGVRATAPGVYEVAGGTLTNWRVMGQMGRLQIKAEDDGSLRLYSRRGVWKRGVSMRPAAPDFFHLDDDPLEPSRLALVRDAAGQVTGVRCGMLAEMRRTEAVAPWA
jgi:D-alanyl-D-alanine carboxypeptidase